MNNIQNATSTRRMEEEGTGKCAENSQVVFDVLFACVKFSCVLVPVFSDAATSILVNIYRQTGDVLKTKMTQSKHSN